MKQSGIMSLVKRRPELKKFLKGPGQPSIDWFVKKTIALKVIQYSNTWSMSRRQAFIKLCNLKSHTRRTGFIMLMDYHFKNKKFPGFWRQRMLDNPDTQINFYKNHVKKWFPKSD